jgi:hypothetical protein
MRAQSTGRQRLHMRPPVSGPKPTSGNRRTFFVLRMEEGAKVGPGDRPFEPVSCRMRTGLREAQYIPPRRKNFDSGDCRRVGRQKSALETGTRRKSSPRAAKPQKSRAFHGEAQKCQFRRSSWWRTQSRRSGLRGPNSLLTGKRTGNSSNFGLTGESRGRKY